MSHVLTRPDAADASTAMGETGVSFFRDTGAFRDTARDTGQG